MTTPWQISTSICETVGSTFVGREKHGWRRMFCTTQVSYSLTVDPAALLADSTNRFTRADENQSIYMACLKTEQKITVWQNRNHFVRYATKRSTVNGEKRATSHLPEGFKHGFREINPCFFSSFLQLQQYRISQLFRISTSKAVWKSPRLQFTRTHFYSGVKSLLSKKKTKKHFESVSFLYSIFFL